MAFDGLGAFVAELDRLGELMRIQAPVDAHLEVAAIADRVMKTGGPALLFENVVRRGRRSPFPLIINAYGSRLRMSAALSATDLDEHVRRIESLLVTAGVPGAIGDATRGKSGLERAFRAIAHLPELAQIPPRALSRSEGAPCQEVVSRGDDVNLDALPVITAWPSDGGPFVTLPVVITRDPQSGARNVGMYRMQQLDRRSTAMHWQVHKTGRRHLESARARKEKLPVAVVLGGDPALAYAATAPLPEGVDELLLAGFLRRRAVQLVKCVSVDLEVPADADFVLEGYVDPEEPLVAEGPFGDHTGYYTPIEPFPRFHVTALTRRRDAIYPTTIVGRPPMEDQWLGKATERLFLPLLRLQIPEIVDMNLPVEGAFHNLCVVSIEKTFPFQARKVAHAIWGAGQMMFTKAIVVVDAEVDVHDPEEVAWRVLANIDPKRDFSFADGPSDHLCHSGDVQHFGGKIVIDATSKLREEGYGREWPTACTVDAATRARIDARWTEYGVDVSKRKNEPPPQDAERPRAMRRIVEAAREILR
jgi:4-hydroxy-3-polyprenylbenzoate decarboxylase